MWETFTDRIDAGRQLAEHLSAYAHRKDVLVLALPRGGVPVAFEVAQKLGAPLDVFLVRKLGVPGHEELAMGALASGGVRVLNAEVIADLGISEKVIDRVSHAEQIELERREQLYRDNRKTPSVRGKTVILVDDGLATGSTMRAAVAAVRKLKPAGVVVAVPTAAPSTRDEFRKLADACVCVLTPEPFRAVGLWYEDFSQTTDEQVLRVARTGTFFQPALPAQVFVEPASLVRGPLMETDHPSDVSRREVVIAAGRKRLGGTLGVPAPAKAVVLFAHGSGSGRFSPRNQYVARRLQEEGLGTLLLDLLDETEAADRERVFDISLLADRLDAATDWLAATASTRDLRLGYFGASTGAGAALTAAARRPERVGAVVSRGGRPDLARGQLVFVQAPTLLIVGGQDEVVLDLNRSALENLHCPKRLVVIPGATHLFPEPGALEEVARLAAEWFQSSL